MRLVLQIVLGILIAAAILDLIYRYEAARDLKALERSLPKISIPVEPLKPFRLASAFPPVHQGVILEPGQQCLGGINGQIGTVIVSSVQNGTPVRTQLLDHGRPVRCVGDKRVYDAMP